MDGYRCASTAKHVSCMQIRGKIHAYHQNGIGMLCKSWYALIHRKLQLFLSFLWWLVGEKLSISWYLEYYIEFLHRKWSNSFVCNKIMTCKMPSNWIKDDKKYVRQIHSRRINNCVKRRCSLCCRELLPPLPLLKCELTLRNGCQLGSIYGCK